MQIPGRGTAVIQARPGFGVYMEGSQIYIGAPNGLVVCVDSVKSGSIQGRMFSAYRSAAVPFENVDTLIYNMNALFDYLDFPREGTNIREFTEEQGKTASQGPQEGHAVREEIRIVREEVTHEVTDENGSIVSVGYYDGDDREGPGPAAAPGAAQEPSPFVRKDRKRVMSDKDLLEQHGYLETFIIRVQHRQNSTWQGRITWADENKTLNFRSIWEMIHLMESALNKDVDPSDLLKEHVWDETDSEESN